MLIHGRILTNEARCRRGMAVSAQCQRCGQLVEDVMHVVRDCPCATEVWSVLYPQGRVPDFYHLTGRDWFYKSLQHQEADADSITWAQKMAITCWALWRWRNLEVFRGEQIPLVKRVLFLFSCFEETKSAFEPPFNQRVGGRLIEV